MQDQIANHFEEKKRKEKREKYIEEYKKNLFGVAYNPTILEDQEFKGVPNNNDLAFDDSSKQFPYQNYVNN